MSFNPISFEQARCNLLEQAKNLCKTQTLFLGDALGRVLVNDVFSTQSIPPQDNSAMDGYAICIADLEGEPPYRLIVDQRIAAGHTGETLIPDTCAQIFTGAPVPDRADAVIVQELVEQKGEWIEFKERPQGGKNIRMKGSDISPDTLLLKKGRKLRPQDIALLASAGIAKVEVLSTLKVAILNTGDELIEPGKALPLGGIYNSNKFLIQAQIQALGLEPIMVNAVEDSLSSICEAITKATQVADVIITTGGVSVGGEDYLRQAIDELGELQAWQVKMKPGKPFAIGKIGKQKTPLLALPGNPVAALINFALFARPFLLLCQGVEDECYQPLWVKAGFDWQQASARMEVLRARLEPGYNAQRSVELYPQQSASSLLAFNWANGLVILPPEKTVKKGDWIEFIPLASVNLY